MYNNKKVLEKNNKGKSIVKKLFEKITLNPRKFISKEQLSKDKYRAFDTQTGFQSNHISQRDNGEWKKAFSQKEIDIINSDEKLSSFCEKFNYD